MRAIRPSSEEEMVALFLRTELRSPRFGEVVRAAVSRLGAGEVTIVTPDLNDERENALRREILGEARGFGRNEGLFGGFPHDVRWSWVGLAPNEVLELRYIDYDYWVELSGGSRRPLDAAERIRAGVEVFGKPSGGFLAAAEEIAATRPPALIVVGEGARLVVLEGHLRLTAYALRPEALPAELEVLLGRSSRLPTWALW